jgi:response regulator RpfG family c-di-GMP phosphodiesterase
MWDGKGWPGELGGEAIPIAARLAQLGEFVEVAHRVGGIDAVRALVQERRGGQFDPAVCDLVDAEAPDSSPASTRS